MFGRCASPGEAKERRGEVENLSGVDTYIHAIL